jgi:hypothetical protein
MVLKRIFDRTAKWAHSLGHFGRLGKVAATRSFLMREKKKLLLKLGEKSLELIQEKKLHSTELARLVGQIEKIQGLISKQDYGGKEGVDFAHPPKSSLRRGFKKKEP